MLPSTGAPYPKILARQSQKAVDPSGKGHRIPRWNNDTGIANNHSAVADIGRYAQLNFPTGTDPIPAVSDWGLVVLLMLFLVAGTLVLGGYRDRSSSRFRFETRRAQ